MFMKRDWRYGAPYYKYVGDTDSTDLAAIFSDVRLNSFFSSIFTVNKFLTGSSDPETGQPLYIYTYTNVGVNPVQLRRDFTTKFENCEWMVPFYFNSDEGNAAAVSRLTALVAEVLDENAYKYQGLAASLGFVYDPLEDFFEKYGGKDEIKREYTDKVNLKEITGPIAGITYDSQTESYTFNFDEIKRIGRETVGGTTTTNGAQIGSVSSNTTRTPNAGGGYTDQTTNTVNYNDSIEVKTSQYKTTMDSDAINRLAGYTTGEGSIAAADNYIEKREIPVNGRILQGNQMPDYTDKKTLGTTKSGRHVPAADLIEAQRRLVQFSLEKEFFDDLKKKMLIAGWN